MDYIDYEIKNEESYTKDYALEGVARVYKDLTYGFVSDKQKLDLYVPENGKRPFPLIIYLHGGGFVQSDKTRHINPMLQGLRYGYAVAGVNYRFMSECQYPGMLHDVTTAIRYLKTVAREYDLDKNKFVVWGETHGGYLACQVGINGGKGTIDDFSAGYENEDSRVAAVVDNWGFTSFQELYYLENAMQAGKENPVFAETTLFGKSGEELEEVLKNTGHPLEDVTGNEPPFYIVHGDRDYMLPLAFSKSYYYCLKAAKVDVTFELLKNTAHGLGNIKRADQLEGTYKFLDRVLKGE